MSAETLEITMPSDREIVMRRTFDAPRQLVFDAWTKPELLRRWYGPRGWELAVCDVDLRVGGGFHYVSRRPGGRDVGQRGVYREVVAPARIVHSESWDDWDVGEVLVTVDLVERDGRTTITSTALYPSKEVRDALVESGMARGAGETYDRLAEMLAATVTEARV